ncbi:hypothetical protein [Methylobacterium gnaphalii]|uniref:Uncharacterized protein n=1 Tax=Methylobacterium gnaphalii TaxID=1010610 RepID=A0A512JFZ0_9HYPH|nr:hypothetical protein [Methylobacterium gnaphalii]GEP08853.1 hypothetical protein MGN01_06980 [Methylobacterium gnaphalii]GJD70365.1 hypothetical protein MMMDOFMJ_3311 [Methylobacterium gnaphalii]GLS47618.1 hypothetical protein GCM10007885_04620 [Methylobacterium gnaphalii]
MGFDTIDTFPAPADLSRFFLEPEPLPVPPPQISDAERKRIERQARKNAGLPDLRAVDVAIVGALVGALERADVVGRMRAQGSAKGMELDLEVVLRDALRGIRRGKVEGQPVTKAAAIEALQQRLRLR